MRKKIKVFCKKLPGNLFKIIVALIVAFPFFYQISSSFMTLKEMYSLPTKLFPATLQFQNYIDAWTSGPFAQYAINSIVVTFSVMAISMVIMIPAAYGFAKFDFRGKNFFFGLILIAFMMPGQVTFLSVYNMFSKAKLLNTVWPQILPFVGNAFGVFFLRQYFMQVPDELIEAAKIDNANTFDIIYRVLVPLSGSALATVLLFCFISRWNDYFWPLIMSNTDSARPLTVGVAMLKDAESLSKYNVIMAGNVILVLPLLLVYIPFSGKIMNSFAYSGIK